MSLLFNSHGRGSVFSSRHAMAMPPVLTDADLAVLASYNRRRKANADRLNRLVARLRTALSPLRG